jgi:hypothetical protein
VVVITTLVFSIPDFFNFSAEGALDTLKVFIPLSKKKAWVGFLSLLSRFYIFRYAISEEN